jgi:hypothetical protein
MMREESRKILKKAFNASQDEDVVIFVGAGATGAINKLVIIIVLKLFFLYQRRNE